MKVNSSHKNNISDVPAETCQAPRASPRWTHLIPIPDRIGSVKISILQKEVLDISPRPGNFPGKDVAFSLILSLS